MPELARKNIIFELLLEDQRFNESLDDAIKKSENLDKSIDQTSKNGGKNIDKLGNKSKGLKSGFESAAGAFKKIFAAGVIAKAIQGLGRIGKAAVLAASDAEETLNKFNVVFKDVRKEADLTAESLADSFGLSNTEAKTLLSNTGDLLSGFGFTGEAALDLSNQVQELAVDLASFTNFSGGAEGASEALTKALLGERESVKALGISILEEDVKKQVAINTAKGLTFATERQAKAQATLDIAVRQSANAIGDFARSQESFANQSRIAQSEISNIREAIGKGLLPTVTQITKSFVSFLKSIDTDRITRFIGRGINALKVAVSPLVNSIRGLGEALFGALGISVDLGDVLNGLVKRVTVFSRFISSVINVVGLLFKALADTFLGQSIIQGVKDLITVFSAMPAIFNGLIEVVKVTGNNISNFFSRLTIDAAIGVEKLKQVFGAGNQALIDEYEKTRRQFESTSLADAFRKGFDEINNIEIDIDTPDTPENIKDFQRSGEVLGEELGDSISKGVKNKIEETLSIDIFGSISSELSKLDNILKNQLSTGNIIGAEITSQIIRQLKGGQRAISETIEGLTDIDFRQGKLEKITTGLERAIKESLKPQNLLPIELSTDSKSILDQIFGGDSGVIIAEKAEEIKQGLKDVFAAAEEAKNEDIAKQETRIEKAKLLAEKGRNDILEGEIDKLDKLKEEREKFVAAQQALDRIEILSSNLVSIAKTKEAFSKAVASAPFPFNIPAVAFTALAFGTQLAGIVNTVSSLGSLPAFKDGIDVFKGKGTATSDSNIVRLSNGEGVIDAYTNKLRLDAGLDNETLKRIGKARLTKSKIVELAPNVKTNMEKGQSSNNDLKALRGEIRELKGEISELAKGRRTTNVFLDKRKVAEANDQIINERRFQQNL